MKAYSFLLSSAAIIGLTSGLHTALVAPELDALVSQTSLIYSSATPAGILLNNNNIS